MWPKKKQQNKTHRWADRRQQLWLPPRWPHGPTSGSSSPSPPQTGPGQVWWPVGEGRATALLRACCETMALSITSSSGQGTQVPANSHVSWWQSLLSLQKPWSQPTAWPQPCGRPWIRTTQGGCFLTFRYCCLGTVGYPRERTHLPPKAADGTDRAWHPWWAGYENRRGGKGRDSIATRFSFPNKGQSVEPGIGVRALGGALQVPIPWGLLGSSMISSPFWHSCTWSSFRPESSQPSCALQGPAPVHLSGRLYLHRHSLPNMESGTPPAAGITQVQGPAWTAPGIQWELNKCYWLGAGSLNFQSVLHQKERVLKGIIALKQVSTILPTALQGRYSNVTVETEAQRGLGTHPRSHSSDWHWSHAPNSCLRYFLPIGVASHCPWPPHQPPCIRVQDRPGDFTLGNLSLQDGSKSDRKALTHVSSQWGG